MNSEKEETLADIVAEKRAQANKIEGKAGRDANQFQRELIHDLRAEADRIEAIAKRAYNNIDSAVCAIDDISTYDIDGVRIAMDSTLGDYYE